MTKTLWTLLLLIGLLAVANSADAGVFGRHLGLGWSDGYHADCDCDHGCRLGLFHRLHGRLDAWRHPSCGKGKCKGAAPDFIGDGFVDEMPPTYVPSPMVIPQ